VKEGFGLLIIIASRSFRYGWGVVVMFLMVHDEFERLVRVTLERVAESQA